MSESIPRARIGDMKETEKQGVDCWESLWAGRAASEQPDLDSPMLENDIDELKIEFLRSRVPADGCAVEVGCGSARLLARVGRAVPLRLYAVDNSPRALDVARATSRTVGIPIECVRADAEVGVDERDSVGGRHGHSGPS